MSSISKYDEGVQKSHHIDANEYSIQVSQQKTSKGNQMAQSIDEHSIQV